MVPSATSLIARNNSSTLATRTTIPSGGGSGGAFGNQFGTLSPAIAAIYGFKSNRPAIAQMKMFLMVSYGLKLPDTERIQIVPDIAR